MRDAQYDNVNARLPSDSVVRFKSKVKDSEIKIAPVIHAMTLLYSEDQEFYELVNAKAIEITQGLKRNERSDKGKARGKQQSERKIRIAGQLYTQEELAQIVGKQ